MRVALVLAGSFLYWQAARRVAEADAGAVSRANLCGIAVLAAGGLTLVLNLLGI